MDQDAMAALTYILDHGSSTLRHDLVDWTLEKSDGKNILFYKNKNYIPKDIDLRRDIARMFHNHELRATQENWKLSMPFDNILVART
jgi:hypothetical protein